MANFVLPVHENIYLYIYMEEHVQLFQLVFLIIAIRELVRFPDPLSDGSGSVFFSKPGGDPVYKGTGRAFAKN